MDERKIKAAETGSGISWEEWCSILEPVRNESHTVIARQALQAINDRGRSTSPEWWAQSVAITYEQEIGVRKAGQQCDGSFSVTISKTLPGTMDDALVQWQRSTESYEDFAGVAIVGEPRTSSTEKWRYWRCDLQDGSKINVTIQTKPNGLKSTLAINHDKLSDADAVEAWRAWWKAFPLN